MGNPTDDGMFNDGEYKHDCPKPLNGCRYPKCSCDVANDDISNAEMDAIEEVERQMEERDYEEMDVEKYISDTEYRQELNERFLDSVTENFEENPENYD